MQAVLLGRVTPLPRLLQGLAPPPFAAGTTFKYAVLRFLSYASDTLPSGLRPAAASSSASEHALLGQECEQGSSCAAFLGYMFFSPLYLVGPIITARDYMQQVAHLAVEAAAAAPSEPPSPGANGSSEAAASAAQKRTTAALLLQLAAWAATVELGRRTLHAPELLLPRHAALWCVSGICILYSHSMPWCSISSSAALQEICLTSVSP